METLLRRVLLTLVPAVVVVGLIHSTIMGDNGTVRRSRMKLDLERVERKLEAVEAQNALLEREVRQLRTDPTMARRAAAEELMLVPPGSVVYRFDD